MKFFKYSLLFLILVIYGCAKKENINKPVVSTFHPAVKDEKVVPTVEIGSVEAISFAENNTIYFDFDVANPKKEELIKIENQAKWLNTHHFQQIIIEGHTDIYGPREYNLALGERRANAIKDILVRYNIDARKIKVVSYGKERLADSNIQSKNRRAVTKVIN